MDDAPVFKLFRNSLPGVRVLGITGVLDSTSKLVIEATEDGTTFDEGLAHARKLGVAEADASYDIEGCGFRGKDSGTRERPDECGCYAAAGRAGKDRRFES